MEKAVLCSVVADTASTLWQFAQDMNSYLCIHIYEGGKCIRRSLTPLSM